MFLWTFLNKNLTENKKDDRHLNLAFYSMFLPLGRNTTKTTDNEGTQLVLRAVSYSHGNGFFRPCLLTVFCLLWKLKQYWTYKFKIPTAARDMRIWEKSTAWSYSKMYCNFIFTPDPLSLEATNVHSTVCLTIKMPLVVWYRDSILSLSYTYRTFHPM